MIYLISIMRITFVIMALVFCVSACSITPSSKNSPSTSAVPSQFSPVDTYDPNLQKIVASPAYGSGKHIITIYADFQCPACINFAKLLGPTFDAYADAGKATIVYKQFPLTTIHKNAYRDAIAWLCAAEQGKYVEAKKALYAMEEKKAGAKVSDEDRINTLVWVGIDAEFAKQCLTENRYAKQIDDEIREWNTLGINGTPTVLLDGTRLDLGIVFSDMEKGKAFLDRVMN